MKKNIIILLFLISLSSFAQNIDVKGKVFDKNSNTPLPNVNITIGNKQISKTDKNGYFSLKTDANSKLVFSLDNYYQLEYKASNVPEIILIKKLLTLGEILNPTQSTNKRISKPISHDINGNSNSISDERTTQKSIYDPSSWSRGGLIGTFDDRERDLIGSPYLDDEFVLGHVYLLNDNNQYSALLRLNVLNNQFEVKINGDIYAISPGEVLLIECDKKYYIPINDKTYNLKFFRVLGKYSNKLLLKYTYAVKKDAEYIEGKSIGNPKIRITKFSEYFIKSDSSDVLTEVKLKKKYIKMIFDNDSRINTFIKNNKLRMKKDEDYKEVFEYYYSLL